MLFFFNSGQIYVWIFEKGVKELNSPLKRAFFFFSTHLSCFHCRSFSIFLLLQGLKAALRSSEIKVKYG